MRRWPNIDIAVFVFFILYFFVGILIFRDYGISWDEPISRNNGLVAYRYVFEGDSFLT